ncbi:MAG: cysteine-rich CWC family protein [Burkholderiales bacterium]|jgi:hypothetical protein|nr:cysteine-rich CWC family protein [Burkholderiales bacterium]
MTLLLPLSGASARTIDPARCPRCGAPNACAMAAGRLDGPCWCTQVTVPALLIESLPDQARGAACLCAACVTGAT